jgi:hypothetical protein
MNRVFFCIALSFSLMGSAAAQSTAEPTPTPVKLVITNTLPPPQTVTQRPKPSPTPIVVGQRPSQPPAKTEADDDGRAVEVVGSKTRPRSVSTGERSFREIKAMIADAKRQLQTRPITIASSGSVYEGVEVVRVAFADGKTNKIDFITLEKAAFLSTVSEKFATSNDGKQVLIATIRGNGVNTPVTIKGTDGTVHLPLIVQYPRVTNKIYEETAFYVSTHPGLVTPEVVNAGKLYVHNVIELARERLQKKGIRIDPKLADIAERLAAVEHVDHQRFRSEEHSKILDDVYTLFALNEGDTYRYAVSSAGAGGMVQMIPSTYRMVRSWHPNVGLNPNFVAGMRDHVNASEAMLLYMQRTWNDLAMSSAVNGAMAGGIANQKHLMAAGYNSNPARLPSYINRGGEAWRTLIPRETQMYLQIYDSVERNVPMSPRTR